MCVCYLPRYCANQLACGHAAKLFLEPLVLCCSSISPRMQLWCLFCLFELKCLKGCSADSVTRDNQSSTITQTIGSAGSFYLNIYVILPLLWKLQTQWRRISRTSMSRTCSCAIASLTVSPLLQLYTMTVLNVSHLSMTRIPHRQENCPWVWVCSPSANLHGFLLPCSRKKDRFLFSFFFMKCCIVSQTLP